MANDLHGGEGYPDGSSVAFVRSDAHLLAALTEGRADDWVTLPDLIDRYDWLMRGIPSFDELSYGLQRLVRGGLIEVALDGGRLRARATSQGIAIRDGVGKGSMASMFGMPEAMGAAPYPDEEQEDRTFGRLPDLEPEVYETAKVDNAKAFQGWAKPLTGLARGIGWLSSLGSDRDTPPDE